jgi:hypothetical protein
MEIRQAISMYLTAKAYNEPEFKVKFENPNKNLDECVTYITYVMYKRVTEGQDERKGCGVAIPSDDEVFALAEQYYIEIVQSRGLQNTQTNYHNKIVHLMKQGLPEIKSRNEEHKMKIAV